MGFMWHFEHILCWLHADGSDVRRGLMLNGADKLHLMKILEDQMASLPHR